MSEPQEASNPYHPGNEYGDARDPSDPGLQPPDRLDPAPITPTPDPGRPDQPNPPKDTERRSSKKDYPQYVDSGNKKSLAEIKRIIGEADLKLVDTFIDSALEDPAVTEAISKKLSSSKRFTSDEDRASSEAKKIAAAEELYDIVNIPGYYRDHDPENPLYKYYEEHKGEFTKMRVNSGANALVALEYAKAIQERAFKDNTRRALLDSRRTNPTGVSNAFDTALSHADDFTSLIEKRKYTDPKTGEEKDISAVKDDYTFDRMIYQTVKRSLVPVETLIKWENLRKRVEQARRDKKEEEAINLFEELHDEQYKFDARLEEVLGAATAKGLSSEDEQLYHKAHQLFKRFTNEGYLAVTLDTASLSELTAEEKQTIATSLNISAEDVQKAILGIQDDDSNRRKAAKRRWNEMEQKGIDTDPLRYRDRAFKILWNVRKRRLRDNFQVTTEISTKKWTQKLGENDDENEDGSVTRIIREPPPPPPPPPGPENPSELPTAPAETGTEEPAELPTAPVDREGPSELPTVPVEQPKVKPKEDFNIGAVAVKDRIPQEVGNLADHVIAHDANKEPRREGKRGVFFGIREALRHPVRSWQNSMLRPVFRRQAEDFVLRAENTVKGADNPVPIELTPELLDKMLTEGMKPPYRDGRIKRFFAAPFRNALGIGLKTDQNGGLKWLRDEMAKQDPSQRDATIQASRGRMLTEQNKLGERYAEVGEGLSLEASNRLALKQGDLEETRHLLEPSDEQKAILNDKVREFLTRYHTDNAFTDEELVKAFNNYLRNDFIQYIPQEFRDEFTAPEYASNILAIAHQVDGRNPDGTRIEGSTMWEDYHKAGENNTPSAWDKLKFNIYYGKGEWGAVRGKNEETLNTRWLARRLESRDYRQSTGTAKGVEYATAVVTYGGSYALAYGAALATIGRGTVARMIPFVGPASVAAIRESGLGWSFRGKWRGFKGNVAREIEQASREAARGRDLQAGSPLRAEYEREALVGRKNAQDYINTINQALNNEQPTDDQMNTLLMELADLKARLDLSDASSTKDLNYKVQNFITYRQGEENEQNAQLRKALQDGVVKLQGYATPNGNFLNNRATEIVSQNGRDGLLEKYALVMNAQLRMSSDGQQMSRWLRQTGLNDAEITQLLALHAALPQERRNISRQESFARKEWNQRRLSARKAAKMFAVTGALSLGTAGLLSETGSFINSPGKDLARWRDIVNGNTPSSDAGATSSIQRAVIFAVNKADRIPYADNAGQMASEVVGTVPGATGQVLSDIHATAQAGQDWTGDLINSVPVAGPIAGGAYGSTKQLADHFIKVGRERGTEFTQEVRPTIDIAQEKGGQLIDKIPYTDRIGNASNAVESTASTGFEDIRQASDSLTLPEGVEITTEDGKKFISYEDTKVDITGLSLESIPPSESNNFTGQIVIKDTAGNIITTDPASFFHEKGIPLEMDYKIGDPIHEQLLDSSLPLHKEAGSQFPDTLIPGGTHWQGDDLVLDSDPNHVLIHDVRIDNNTGEILFQTDHDPAVDYSGAAGTEVVLNNTGEITLDPTNLRSNIPPGTQIIANTDGSFDLVVKNDPSIELIQGVRVDSTTGEVTYDSIHSGVHFTSETGPTTTILQSGLEGKLTPTDLDTNLPPGIKAEHLANGNIRLYPEADQSITLLEGKFDGNTFTTLHASSELKVIETITPETHLTGDAAKAELLTYGTQVEWGTGYWNDTSIAEKAELQMHTFHTLNGNGNHVLTVSLHTNPYDTAQQTGVGEIYLPDVIREDKIALTIWLPDHTGTPILLRDSMDGKIDGSFIFDPDSTTPITLGNRTTTIGELTKMVIDGDALASTPMGNNATEYNQFFNVGKLGADGKYGYFSTAYIARDGNNPLLREITTIKYNGGLNIATPGSAEYAFKTIDDITKESTAYKLQIDEITKRAPGFIAVQDITEDHATKVPFLLISDIPEDSGFSLDVPYPPFVPGRRNIEKSRLGDRQATGEATAANNPNTPQTPTPVLQNDDENEDGLEINETDEPGPVPPQPTPEDNPEITPFPEADAPVDNTDDVATNITPFPTANDDEDEGPVTTPFPETNTPNTGTTPFTNGDAPADDPPPVDTTGTTPFPPTNTPQVTNANATPDAPADDTTNTTPFDEVDTSSNITPFPAASATQNITPADNSDTTPFGQVNVRNGTTPFPEESTTPFPPAAEVSGDEPQITPFGEVSGDDPQTTPFDSTQNPAQITPADAVPESAEITPFPEQSTTPFPLTTNQSIQEPQTTPFGEGNEKQRDDAAAQITPFEDTTPQITPADDENTRTGITPANAGSQVTPFSPANTSQAINTNVRTAAAPVTSPANITPFDEAVVSSGTTPFPEESTTPFPPAAEVSGDEPQITPFDQGSEDESQATPFGKESTTSLTREATIHSDAVRKQTQRSEHEHILSDKEKTLSVATMTDAVDDHQSEESNKKVKLDDIQAEVMLNVYPEEAKLMIDQYNTLLPIYKRKYATELSNLSTSDQEKFLIDHIAPTIIGGESLAVLISRIEQLAREEAGQSKNELLNTVAVNLRNKFLSLLLATELKRQAGTTPAAPSIPVVTPKNDNLSIKPLTIPPKKKSDDTLDTMLNRPPNIRFAANRPNETINKDNGFPKNTPLMGQQAVLAEAIKRQIQRPVDNKPLAKAESILSQTPTPSVYPMTAKPIRERLSSDLFPFNEKLTIPAFKKITPPPSPPSVSPQAWRQGQSLRSATSLSPFGDPTPAPETSFNRIKPSSTATESTILSNQEEQKPNIPSSNSETSLLNSLTKTYTEDINKMASTYIKDKPRIMSVLRSDIQEVDERKISESAFKRIWGIDVSIVKQIDDKEIDGFLRDYFARRYYSDSSKLEDIITIRANWEALDEKTKKKISIQKLQEIAAEKGAYTEAIDNYLASINVTPAEFWGASEDEVDLTESFRSNMTRNLLDLALSKRGL